MNKIAIFEIGDIIHVRYRGLFKRVMLSPEEIIQSYEFKKFEEACPELCRLAKDKHK